MLDILTDSYAVLPDQNLSFEWRTDESQDSAILAAFELVRMVCPDGHLPEGWTWLEGTGAGVLGQGLQFLRPLELAARACVAELRRGQFDAAVSAHEYGMIFRPELRGAFASLLADDTRELVLDWWDSAASVPSLTSRLYYSCALELIGRHDEAIRTWGDAADTSVTESLWSMGDFLADDGLWGTAAALFESAWRRGGGLNALLSCAEANRRASSAATAIRLLGEGGVDWDSDWPAVLELARCYAAASRWAEVINGLEVTDELTESGDEIDAIMYTGLELGMLRERAANALDEPGRFLSQVQPSVSGFDALGAAQERHQAELLAKLELIQTQTAAPTEVSPPSLIDLLQGRLSEVELALLSETEKQELLIALENAYRLRAHHSAFGWRQPASGIVRVVETSFDEFARRIQEDCPETFDDWRAKTKSLSPTGINYCIEMQRLLWQNGERSRSASLLSRIRFDLTDYRALRNSATHDRFGSDDYVQLERKAFTLLAAVSTWHPSL